MKAQLHGSGNLVDVLAAGTGGTDKAFLQIVFTDRQAIVDADDVPVLFHGKEIYRFVSLIQKKNPAFQPGLPPPQDGKSMSPKSGNRFLDKDMRRKSYSAAMRIDGAASLTS